jgi:general stress protein 26
MNDITLAPHSNTPSEGEDSVLAAAIQTKREGMDKLRQLIHEIRIATLVTMDVDGELRGRPMATQDLDENSELWFFTNDYSAKVDNVMVHPQVCVSYADPAASSYVSISGKAELVRDRDTIRSKWKPLLKAWFPLGEDDPDLALLRVEVMSAQYWESSSSKLVQLFGMVKAIATGQSAAETLGEGEKLTVRERIGSDTAT